MSAQSEMLAALESGDAKRCALITKVLYPHMPPPENDLAVDAAMHLARTDTPAISFRARAWSHRWLTERGLPSRLPDDLKPRAERLYPRVVEAVFVSANTNSPFLKPVAKLVQASMCDAVEEAAADGKLGDPGFVRARMEQARVRTFQQLLGKTIGGTHG